MQPRIAPRQLQRSPASSARRKQHALTLDGVLVQRDGWRWWRRRYVAPAALVHPSPAAAQYWELAHSLMASMIRNVAREYVALRRDPEKPDPLDAERIHYYMRKWNAQNGAYMGYARTVEEHIRMLSGRQWDLWSDMYGRFIDVLQFMDDKERRHAMRPVMDYLGYWYALTLSKVLENRGVISFQPATSDRVDEMLAEVMEPVWKTLWDQMEMDQRRARMAGWCLIAGEGYYHTRVDFEAGERRELIRPAVLQLLGPDGRPIAGPDGHPIERTIEAAPYDADGNVLAQLQPDPESGDYGYDVTGDPYQDLEGMPKVDVLCPLQVRAQWGSHIPWRDKRWIAHETFLTPDQVFEQAGVECDPDHYVSDDAGPGQLERMLFGTGYFGATQSDFPSLAGSEDQDARQHEGYVRVLSFWEKPRPRYTPMGETAGGRFIMIAPGAEKVLWDSERPFRTECAGPIRRIGFLDIVGRPHYSTMLEKMVPLQKRLNRIEKHISQHTNLVTDPILLVHDAAGIDGDEWVAEPGSVITHGYNGPGRPAEWLAPPGLSADVYKEKSDITEQLFIVGSMAGNQSQTPTPTASGELVEQLRVNADRPLTPLTQNMVMGESDVAMDVMAILPTIWDQEKMIAYAGEDNVVRTITVIPEMFDGRVNVRPNLESAAAESKDRKRERLIQLYQLGAFGNIADPMQQPKAVQQLLQLVNFPELTRAARPGGTDRVMAEHNLGRLIRGDSAQDIPLLEMYDFAVHLSVVEEYMKSPEFVENTDEQTAAQLVLYREAIMAAQQAQQLNAIARTMPIAQATAAAQGAVATVQQASSPQPPTDATGKPGAAESGAKPRAAQSAA
jgi:hypothetical protein